jgi:hypothetical protein
MTWSIVSEEAKRKKKILQYEQKRLWHKWWAWHPVSIKTEDYKQWVWFEPVYRRANNHFPWRTFCKYRWEYTTDFELLKQIY